MGGYLWHKSGTAPTFGDNDCGNDIRRPIPGNNASGQPHGVAPTFRDRQTPDNARG